MKTDYPLMKRLSIEEQAAQVLAIFPTTRFNLPILIRLYMIQESFELAEDRIRFLAQGTVHESLIHQEIDRYEGELDLDGRLIFQLRQNNLKRTIARIGGFAKETKFSPYIRQRQNALDSLKAALDNLEEILKKADPVLLTAKTKAYIDERQGRLAIYQAKLETKLNQLKQWHEVELNNGDYQLIDPALLPAPERPFITGQDEDQARYDLDELKGFNPETAFVIDEQ